jgi:hypothetical protein
MTDQNNTRTTRLSIDEPTAREIMSYYGIDSHDELARYIRYLGIEHND